MVIDGSFKTARQKAAGKGNQAMVALLDDKTKEINTLQPQAPFKYQEHHFPAKFADIPPIIVMEAASRISTKAAAGEGAVNQNKEFNHWIEMIKTYGSTRGQTSLKFNQQLPSKDVRLGLA